MGTKKLYMATEETHIRIANALEKLAAKNFCGGNGSSNGGTSGGDVSVPVDPSEFMTELYWSNGATQSVSPRTMSTSGGLAGMTNPRSTTIGHSLITKTVEGTEVINPQYPISDIIKKPIILRMPLLGYQEVLSAGTFITPFLSLIPYDIADWEQNPNKIVSYHFSSMYRLVISDFSIYHYGYYSGSGQYEIGAYYMCNKNFHNNGSTTATYEPRNFQFSNLTADNSETTTEPLALALKESSNDLYIYINPEKHIVNIYWNGDFDENHLLGSFFLPETLKYMPESIDEEGNTIKEKGARIVIGDMYGLFAYPTFANGYDTSAESENVIVPTTALDDGFSYSRIFDGSIQTLC